MAGEPRRQCRLGRSGSRRAALAAGAPGGTAINISSIAAHRGGSGSCGAAKAAVENWDRTLAQNLGTDRITANVIAPGTPRTPSSSATA